MPRPAFNLPPSPSSAPPLPLDLCPELPHYSSGKREGEDKHHKQNHYQPFSSSSSNGALFEFLVYGKCQVCVSQNILKLARHSLPIDRSCVSSYFWMFTLPKGWLGYFTSIKTAFIKALLDQQGERSLPKLFHWRLHVGQSLARAF